MCGIAGVFDFQGSPADPGLLRSMAEALHHRGPDDEGVFGDGGVGLAFKRLSIIDLSGGHQPMTSDCGRYTVIFNGEIYNHADLRRVLETDHGVRFHTRSDTEVILAAYRCWGADALRRFNGMFAFALWDSRDRSLFLARDRMGKKPLYYASVPGGIVFASEVRALFRHPGVRPAVDRSRIATFIAYRYVPGEETLFEGVRCLPPASHLTVNAAGIGRTETYWDYSFAAPAPGGSQEALRSELWEVLNDAVRLRMIADVPLGAFLSGGLDSSIVVALMSRIHPEPLKTFSIGFDTGMSEEAHARVVARQYGTEHHEIIVSSRELLDNIPAVLQARETPITEASDIPLFLLSKLARQKVTVVLSGEGSDEIFAGYPKYAFARTLGPALGLLPRSLLRTVAARLPFGLRRAQLALESVAQSDPLERYAVWFGAFGPEQRRALLAPELTAQDGIHAFSAAALDGKQFHSAVEEMLYLDTRHWLPANLLLRGDRMTMAHSLELRCPFLDYRLVELASRIPMGMKIHGLAGKWILKSLAAGILPPEIVNRPKWGFKVPLAQWFRGPLQGVVRDVLLSRAALARGYFAEAPLRELVDAHVSGRKNYEKQLWILLQLELWHLMFVDRTLSPADRLA
jgi:asparagine synthase (glutamine-hydrolysing)